MGWGSGEDSKGRLIGYCHQAQCDHPECKARIHRGLAHACGDMHGEDEFSCEGYFCGQHRYMIEIKAEHAGKGEGKTLCLSVCASCREALEKAGILVDD